MSDFTFLAKTSVAVAAILVVTGCTTESSSQGCGAASSGYTGTAKSELGEGSFTYSDATPASKYPGPAAVGKGGEFSLTYKRYDDDTTPLALRAAAPVKLVAIGSEDETAATMQFRAPEAGVFAVLAVSTTDANQVVDLMHVRVLEPSKLRFTIASALNEDDAAALEKKGTIRIPKGGSARVVGDVLGEVDEANGPLGEHSVGELVLLGGIKPRWETTDAEVVDFAPEEDGSVRANAKGIGTADVTVSAGNVKRVVHVNVTSGGY